MPTLPYLNRPDHAFQIAFNADPNDPTAVPSWTDLTNRFRSASAISRGRQYELAITLPAQPSVLLRDPNEDLNPLNPSSPFSPNVDSYRRVLWQCVWPNGATGNLINANAWRGNLLPAYDPTFDSYPLGGVNPTQPVWWVQCFNGVTGSIATTPAPRSGTRSVVIVIPAAGTGNLTSFTVATIPGRQYTASCYVKQTAANTLRIGIGGGGLGTSTTTTGAYVRLTVTFTASQPLTVIDVLATGTILLDTVNIDDIQLDQGAAATTFTTTGPAIYPVMANYAERFEKTWLDSGYTGYVSIPCVDALTALSSIKIGSEYPLALAATNPDYSWPLDGGGPTWLPGPSGLNAPAIGTIVAKSGPGPGISPGSSINIIGQPGAGGVQFPGKSIEPMTAIGLNLKNGSARPTPGINLPTSTTLPWSLTTALWFQQPAGSVTGAILIQVMGGASSDYVPLQIVVNNGGALPGMIVEFNADFSINLTAEIIGPTTLSDGNAHLITVVESQDATNINLALYVDGALFASGSGLNSTYGVLKHPATGVLIGAEWNSFTQKMDAQLNGTVAWLSFWNRALGSGEIAGLWTAGGLGYAGELSGTRIARHLNIGGYTGVPISGQTPQARISPGSTQMGPPSFIGQIDLSGDSNNTTVAEQGTFWVAPDGLVVFEGRNDRWVRLASSWTFGNIGTAMPYLGDMEDDTDPTFVFADVEVTRSGAGAAAIGGLPADILTANKRYFNRQNAVTADLMTDAQAQDMANWIFYSHNHTTTRIAALTIDPTATNNPATSNLAWDIALGVEVGQRVTRNLKLPGANGGAGLTINLDFFVENVTHDQIDMDAGTWITTLLLSPVASGTSQSQQPFILDSATYGVLNQNKLGW